MHTACMADAGHQRPRPRRRRRCRRCCRRRRRRENPLPCSSALCFFSYSTPSCFPLLSHLHLLGCCPSTRKDPEEAMWFGLGRAPATEGGKRLRAEGESCPQTRRSLARCRQPAGNSTATAEITATIKMPAVRPRATAWSAVSPCLSSPRLLGGGALLAGNGLPSRFAGSIPERVVCQQRLWFPAPATSTPPFSENTFFATSHLAVSKVRWGAVRGRVPRE